MFRRRATIRRAGGDPVTASFGPVNWRGLPPGAAPWEQIGVYGEPLQNQFPAYWPDVQLHQGVEGIRIGYMTPSRSLLPDFRQTQQRAYNSGPQRVGSNYSGPVGPLSVNDMTARVTAAQVRQSGLSALSWAAQLSEG